MVRNGRYFSKYKITRVVQVNLSVKRRKPSRFECHIFSVVQQDSDVSTRNSPPPVIKLVIEQNARIFFVLLADILMTFSFVLLSFSWYRFPNELTGGGEEYKHILFWATHDLGPALFI